MTTFGHPSMLSQRDLDELLGCDAQPQGHFRRLAPSRELASEAITENPDAMEPEELHRRAHDIIVGRLAADRGEALDRLNALFGAGSSRATTRPDDIVKAAHRSRVDTLFLSGEEPLWGTFDEAHDHVVVHGTAVADDVDLFDDAALMTLRYGARVILVEPALLPSATRAAAILRY